MNWVKVVILCICLCSMEVFATDNKIPLQKIEPLSQKVVINTKQMNFNDLFNVIRNNTETSIVVAPEFGDAKTLKMVLALPRGVITLRELLDIICIQLQGKWLASGDGDRVVINAMSNQNTVMEKNPEPSEILYSIESDGKTLKKVLTELHKKSGAEIVIYGGVGGIKIEVFIKDASFEKILTHIAFLYDLKVELTESGIYRVGR